MPWSWYLACDMQYFITGLFILTVFVSPITSTVVKSMNDFLHCRYLRWRPVGLALAIGLVFVGVVSGYMLLSANTSAQVRTVLCFSRSSPFISQSLRPYCCFHMQDNYFDKPYTRVTPFAIGILLGILFVDRDLVRMRVPSLISSLMMFVSLGVMGGVIYVDYVNFTPKTKPWSARQDAAYQSFGRLGFALAVAVVSFTCVNNNHGLVNRFLSLGIWEPLGKLTYGAYLVHPIIIRAYYYQQVMRLLPACILSLLHSGDALALTSVEHTGYACSLRSLQPVCHFRCDGRYFVRRRSIVMAHCRAPIREVCLFSFLECEDEN